MEKRIKSSGTIVLSAAALSLFTLDHARADIPLSDGVAYTQDFNSMTGNKGGTVTPPVLPTQWVYTGEAINTGSGGDRALGVGGVNNGNASFGTSFQILTGGPTVNLAISYTGEQWYYGGSQSIGDFLDFEYSLDATSLTTGTWTPLDSLDFNGPGDGLNLGAQATDGNDALRRTTLSDTLSLSNVANNDVVWIRWSNVGTTGDQLAIDDFSITASAVPEPSSLALLGLGGLLISRRRRG